MDASHALFVCFFFQNTLVQRVVEIIRRPLLFVIDKRLFGASDTLNVRPLKSKFKLTLLLESHYRFDATAKNVAVENRNIFITFQG